MGLKLKLTIEPIPEKNWHNSLAHKLPKPVWDKLRREVYEGFNRTCIVCGTTNKVLHCHESWVYNDKRHTQFLKGFQCLCEDCHNVKHWGRTVVMVQKREFPSTYIQTLTEHFCKVNNCYLDDFNAHKVEVGAKLQERNRHTYIIDFGKFSPEKLVEDYSRLNK